MWTVKRYDCNHPARLNYCMDDDPDGEWVLYEDYAKLRAVVAALPACETCGKPATHIWRGGSSHRDYGCDEHNNGDIDRELPYADALRALMKP
jgi:hypothetical protein